MVTKLDIFKSIKMRSALVILLVSLALTALVGGGEYSMNASNNDPGIVVYFKRCYLGAEDVYTYLVIYSWQQ